MMKRLLLAASVLALAAGSAFAQGNEQAPPMPPPPSAAPAPGAPPSTGAVEHRATHAKSRHSVGQIKAAQKALKEDGLYKGKIDGKYGPATKAAVAEFQKQNDLKETSQLDKETMSKLMAGGGGTAH